MPERDDLTQLLPPTGPQAIDTDAVIRRARRRRLPQQLAVGGAAVVVLAGGVVGGLALTQNGASSSLGAGSSAADESTTQLYAEGDATTTDPGDSSAGGSTGMVGGDAAGGETVKMAPIEKLNGCEGALAEVAPAASGLVLTTAFPDVIDAGAASVEGEVTLTNTGDAPVTGYTGASPAITLSRDGVTIWHSNGPTIMMAAEVDLQPGESMTYTATLVPVVCTGEDEGLEAFRDDLPAAPAGDYDVSAALLLSGSDPSTGEAGVETVTGPLQAVSIVGSPGTELEFAL